MQDSENRVIMAKSVARKWLKKKSHVEYRMQVYNNCSYPVRNLPDLLRSFRDGRLAMKGVNSLPDLGIRENFDNLELWSSNRESLITLKNWFEQRGLETSGIW